MKNMRVLLLLLSCVSCNHISAQSWFRQEATWWYNLGDFDPYYNGYELMTVTKDTIIETKACKILKIDGSVCPNDKYIDYYYVYEDSNRVYYWDAIGQTFRTLYDFNLNTGDSYSLVWRGDSFPIHIDSIRFQTINNSNLKVMFASGGTLATDFEGEVIQFIGNIYHFFPITELWTEGADLRCYDDSVIGGYSVSNVSCDSVYYTGIDNSDKKMICLIYPNPANDFCTLQLDAMGGAYTAMFIDITGREIMTFKITGTTQIPISNLPAGLYFVKVSDGPDSSRYLSGREGHVGVAKLIKSAE